jgi:hypothetical protein
MKVAIRSVAITQHLLATDGEMACTFLVYICSDANRFFSESDCQRETASYRYGILEM